MLDGSQSELFSYKTVRSGPTVKLKSVTCQYFGNRGTLSVLGLKLYSDKMVLWK